MLIQKFRPNQFDSVLRSLDPNTFETNLLFQPPPHQVNQPTQTFDSQNPRQSFFNSKPILKVMKRNLLNHFFSCSKPNRLNILIVQVIKIPMQKN